MKKVSYMAVRTEPGGDLRVVTDQLPGAAMGPVYNALRDVGARVKSHQWAEIRASALEVSATGVARKMWFGARHYLHIMRVDQRPR